MRIARRGPSFSVMNLAIAATEPLSSISLPNRAPSRKIGKNCAIKRDRAVHEGLRPIGEQRLAGESGGDQRGAGGEQQDAPAPIRQPDEEHEADRMPNSPIASHALFSKHVEIIGGALAQIRAVCLEERSAARRPASRSMHRKSHSALSFEE